jgi:hypothetical protein
MPILKYLLLGRIVYLMPILKSGQVFNFILQQLRNSVRINFILHQLRNRDRIMVL